MNTKKMNNMATSHPKLLKWFASDSPISVFIKISPVFCGLLWLIFKDFYFDFQSFFALNLGVFVWSFFEYAVHRWVYHVKFQNKKLRWFFESFHIYHHQKMDDHHVLNAGFLLIYPLFIAFFGLSFLVLKDLKLASWFCLGLLIYYFFYECVHYLLHFRTYEEGYLAFIQKYHLHHHYKNWNSNFGNTTVIWDLVFSTYDARYKNLVLDETEKSHLNQKK